MIKTTLLFGLLISPFMLLAQPFSKKYIMAFHTCNAACTGFMNHQVHLAESNDGSTWSLVPNFVPYTGSVPDVITRGSKLYIYTPGQVKRYNQTTNTWDQNTQSVAITDSAGNPVQYVDPSAVVDSAGHLVLFFLNSTGTPMGQDPASCQTYPCIKYFDSASEVPGSDGTQFTKNAGHRMVITLNSGTASDPDIFQDPSGYKLYISKGNSVYACSAASLHGSYSSIPALTNGILTNQGGIPCGWFDESTNQYWTYVHTNQNGNIVIRQAIHTNLNNVLSNFNTVLAGPQIGEPASTTTESPSICLNTLTITGLNEPEKSSLQLSPNPCSSLLTIKANEVLIPLLTCFNATGAQLQLPLQKVDWNTYQVELAFLPEGMYWLQVSSTKKTTTAKVCIQK